MKISRRLLLTSVAAIAIPTTDAKLQTLLRGDLVSGPQTSVPLLTQHVASSANPVSSGGISGNNFKFFLPNSVGAGNCLVIGITFPHGNTAAIADNNGNTWPVSPAVSADAGSGNYVSQIWVLPNANAGVTAVTVSFGASVQPFNYKISEFAGIVTVSPVNGTSSAAGITGASLSTGSFTPGNNNANGGNLIWNYYAPGAATTTDPTSWVPGGSFTLLDADIAWTNGLSGFPHASQYFVQTTSASINPGITATADTSTSYNAVAVALKIGNAGTRPAAGVIRINKILHQSVATPANLGPPASWTLQQPATGNLRVLATANNDFYTTITGITDSDGGTWTLERLGTDQCQIWWSGNRTPNPNFKITINTSGTTQKISTEFFDITNANASPFDVVAGIGFTDISGLSTINDYPAITPTAASGLVIAICGLTTGPGLGFAAGAPSGAIFDLVTYTGETDSDVMDNADCCAHLYYSGTGAQNWNWTITSQVSNQAFATAASFH